MFKVLKTVSSKLYFTVALLSLVAVVAGGIGLTRMQSINDRLNHIVEVASTKQLLAARSRQAITAIHRAQKNLILAKTPAQMDGYAEVIESENKSLLDNLAKLEALATSDTDRERIEDFREVYRQYTAVDATIRDNSREASNQKAAEISATTGREYFDNLESGITQLAASNDEAVTQLIGAVRKATDDEVLRQKLKEADAAASRALLSARLRANMIAMQRAEKNFILAQTKAEMQAFETALLELHDEVKQQIAEIRKTVTDDNRELVEAFVKNKEQWFALNEKVRELSFANTNQVAFNLSANEGRELMDSAEAELKQIADAADEAMVLEAKESDQAYSSARMMIISTVSIGVLVGLAISIWIVRGITRGLRIMVNRLKDIAEGEGDLTQRIDVQSDDEIGQLGKWFNVFVSKIHDVIVEVTDASTEVAAASTEIAASTEQIATGTKDQTAQLTQISTAVEEMSSSVIEVARKSADASASANESGRIATDGGQVVGETIDGMKSINSAVTSSAASVQELGKRGEQIGEVITVINDIADQTNLLALNAAIEAARAGEHGRGFAVVADEVRKLADRTTTATEEIAGSIEAIQSETTDAVQKMGAGTEEVNTGMEKAEQAGEALKQIVASAEDVSSMVESIAAATEEQSAASEQVSKNIEQIAAITRESSEGSAQAAAATTQLSMRAEALQEMVGRFKTSRG